MPEMENKREYEMSYLLTAEVPEEKIDAEKAELIKLISENQGESIELSPVQKRRLSYPVKKQKQAYFGVVYFSANEDGLSSIKKAVSLNKKFLRFLIVGKTEAEKPATSRSFETSAERKGAAESPIESFDKKLENILRG